MTTKKQLLLTLSAHIAAQLIGAGKRASEAIEISIDLSETLYAAIDERHPDKPGK